MPVTALLSLSKLFFSNNSQVSISLKKKLNHIDEMSFTNRLPEATELDLSVDLSDDKSLDLS